MLSADLLTAGPLPIDMNWCAFTGNREWVPRHSTRGISARRGELAYRRQGRERRRDSDEEIERDGERKIERERKVFLAI